MWNIPLITIQFSPLGVVVYCLLIAAWPEWTFGHNAQLLIEREETLNIELFFLKKVKVTQNNVFKDRNSHHNEDDDLLEHAVHHIATGHHAGHHPICPHLQILSDIKFWKWIIVNALWKMFLPFSSQSASQARVPEKKDEHKWEKNIYICKNVRR